jgi:serine protease Do
MRRLFAFLLGLLSIAFGTVVHSDDQVSETKVESSGAELQLPPVFSKRDPESLADLREMQGHIKAVSAKVGPTVVGIQIGGAQGSGVIISKDGYVLTAGHVSGAPGRRARIILPSGDVVEGTTLGRNRVADAGLVKIKGTREDWPHAPMAASESIDRGEWCLVMGHPGGYTKDRPAPLRFGRVLYVSKNTIQTDCELVGGDSGGPVFDMEGRVIGINSRIGPQTPMNFHAAIGAFHSDWDKLIASEDLQGHTGAFLGVSGEKVESGVKVTTVFEKSPAEAAGVKIGDVIVTFQGKKVEDLDRLVDLVGLEPPGRRIKLQVLRDGKPKDFEFQLGELPD